MQYDETWCQAAVFLSVDRHPGVYCGSMHMYVRWLAVVYLVWLGANSGPSVLLQGLCQTPDDACLWTEESIGWITGRFTTAQVWIQHVCALGLLSDHVVYKAVSVIGCSWWCWQCHMSIARCIPSLFTVEFHCIFLCQRKPVIYVFAPDITHCMEQGWSTSVVEYLTHIPCEMVCSSLWRTVFKRHQPSGEGSEPVWGI